MLLTPGRTSDQDNLVSSDALDALSTSTTTSLGWMSLDEYAGILNRRRDLPLGSTAEAAAVSPITLVRWAVTIAGDRS
jgi:hypothetical protein